MFAGSLKNFETERKYYPDAIVRALDYLAKTDFSKMENGKYEIEGTAMYVNVQEVITGTMTEKKAERHDKYIDVQYLISGGDEIYGYAPYTDGLEVLEDRLDTKDVIFYKNVPKETKLLIEPGQFAVFFPTDVHRPGCSDEPGKKLRKAIVKVSVDLL